MLSMKVKILIMATSSILMTEIIWRFHKRRSQIKAVKVSNGHTQHPCKDRRKIRDVMFFSKDSALCRPHLTSQNHCGKANCAVRYFRRIIDYLNSATDSMDICMYFLTCSPLVNAITNAHKKGVRVRIILDEYMAQNQGSQTMCFHKEGIKPKFKKLGVLMHHKFVIIDNNILITGSTNWTMSAFFGNFENIMVTNESELVQPFINEFEKLWKIINVKETIELEEVPHNS